jgi:hypothetical protein
LSLSPQALLKKALWVAQRESAALRQHKRDAEYSTYSSPNETPAQKLLNYLTPPPIDCLRMQAKQIAAVTSHYLGHRFDLLGSGWVQVKHGMDCRGLEGHVYKMSSPVYADPAGEWLRERINTPNLVESQRIWRLLDDDYVPIDWHLDFKSGYRWTESTWYRRISYGDDLGVDIKVPWELARMQHLLQLVWAYGLAVAGEESFEAPEAYAREFRNQVLDFISTNPPRFGVSWQCTMDVAIRVANWLAAYDLFSGYGAEFGEEFQEIFYRSIHEHGLHIVSNLEWDPGLRANHYLANIVGLLFVAAYIPSTVETDSWLAFAVQELIQEVESQFYSDGGNFEASTAYHGLAAEMVIYATALVLALPQEKVKALSSYDYATIKGKPGLKPAPLPHYPLAAEANPKSEILNPQAAIRKPQSTIPFPPWYIERLEKMAEFSMHLTGANGLIPQFGDNDNGRFLKFQPVYHPLTVVQAKARYANLTGYNELPDDAVYWAEEHLEQGHLVAAVNGLFGRYDFAAFAGESRLETNIVRSMVQNLHFPSYHSHGEPTSAELVRIDAERDVERIGITLGESAGDSATSRSTGDPKQEFSLYGYPEFGLYLYRAKQIYCAVRCGSIGQNGNGGHAHNDQLSFELAVDGIPIIVDPGTYLYTPLPERRNAFRSTAKHNTLRVAEREQNKWYKGIVGLFGMIEQTKAIVREFSSHRFVGEHSGFGLINRRTLTFHLEKICGFDEYAGEGEKVVSFHLAQKVKYHFSEELGMVDLDLNNTRIRLHSKQGDWVVLESFYSPAYGVLERCHVLVLRSSSNQIQWMVEIDG